MSEKGQRGAIANAKKEIENKRTLDVMNELFNAEKNVQFEENLKINIDSILIREIIARSYFFEDIGGKNLLQAMIDPVSQTISLVNLEALLRKEDKKTKEVYRAFFVYIPQMKGITGRDENNHPILNLYEPPIWRKNEYFSNKEQTIEKEIPEIYYSFIMHLVDDDLDSYSAVLNWLAYSLVGRNPTYLIFVGGKGAGKGIFGKILYELHGKKNFMTMTNDTFTRQFNSEVDGHTIGYLDELHMKKNARKQISKLKLLNNDEVRVEKKTLDAMMVKNHMNLYISSNDYEGIPLESDNRRLTIPYCTHKPLIETDLIKRIDEITKPENICKLGQYLLTITPTFEEVRDPFVSPIVKEKIWDANVKEWEGWAYNWFLFSLPELAKTEEVRIEIFQEAFRKENPHSPISTIGREKVKDFLNDNECLGWYLKKVPSKPEEEIKGYRYFERIENASKYRK